MKTYLTSIATTLCLTFATSELAAQGKKGDTLSGIVVAVDGNQITVNHRRESKTFTIDDKTKIAYVSFLDADKEIKAGFFIRAQVDGKGRCGQLWVTLPIPEDDLKPSEEMLKMTPEELFDMADSNGDEELSYVEYATAIYRSPKHGPVGFNKSDKNKSGTLNLKEFATKLGSIKWYRMSRKTPAEWHAEFDADSNGALNKKEFIAFLGSTAHIETFLKRADQDGSGGISVEELAGVLCLQRTAVDYALWDLLGRETGRPVYELLGGPVRDRIRIYYYGKPPKAQLENEDAWRALGRDLTKQPGAVVKVDPWLVFERFGDRKVWEDTVNEAGGKMPTEENIAYKEMVFRCLREGAGDKADLIHGGHGQCNAEGAIATCKPLEPYDLLWIEDPTFYAWLFAQRRSE